MYDIHYLLNKVLTPGNNPKASFVRPNNATPYTIGDVVGPGVTANLVFSEVSNIPGVEIMILDTSLRIDVAAIPAGMAGFNLHLFSSAPTPIADNAPFTIIDADRDKYLKCIQLSVPVKRGTNMLWSQDDGVNIAVKLNEGSANLYGVLETLGAYTQTAECAKTIILDIAGV